MTESVEMYLVSIAQIAAASQEETVPLPALAERLEILPVSTNQMIRKLEEEGLVRYLPYKGVQLTDQGQQIAAQVLRHHRLWDAFLREHLQFSHEAAEALACRLEHIFSEDEIGHLERFLSHSGMARPAGIPTSGLEVCLSELNIGQSATLLRSSATAPELSFLAAAGLVPGVTATVLARGGSGDILVRVTDREPLHLSAELAAKIWLKKD